MPMLRICSSPGCETLTLGELCRDHELAGASAGRDTSETDSRLSAHAPGRRPLRGHLLGPAARVPAGVDAAPDAEG